MGWQSSNNWSSDNNLFLQTLSYLDNPFVSFACGALLAFSLLGKVLKIDIAHPLILSIIATIGYLLFSALGWLLLVVTGIVLLMPSPLLPLIFLPIFHFVTKVFPTYESWQILQRPLLIISIPLVLISVLPIQNTLIKSSSLNMQDLIAQQFFGEHLDEAKNAIRECNLFIENYGAIKGLKISPDVTIGYHSQNPYRGGGSNLTFNFSTDIAFGTISTRFFKTEFNQKQNTEYQLNIRSTHQPSQLKTDSAGIIKLFCKAVTNFQFDN